MTPALALAAALLLGQHIHHESTPEHADPPSSESIYNLKAKWTDQAGKKVTLIELRGQPVVIAMIYSSCQTVCPLIVSDTKRIQQALPEALRAKVQMVLVSFDPTRDTPERLAKYAVARGLEGKQWTLLTGEDDGVRELAALLGMRYRPTGTGDFAHSNLITVLDAKGVIAFRREGVGQDVAPAVAAVVAASGK